MTYLVTGVAGFIGSNLVEYLSQKGESIIGIDNLSDYYPKKIKKLNLKEISHCENFTFIKADLTSKRDMEPIFKEHKFDALINLAGYGGVSQSFEAPMTYVQNNAAGVVNLLELCKEYGVKKFVQASTSSEYGDNKIPWKEDMNLDRPLHPYAGSKRAAEIFGYIYHIQYGIDFNATVFFNVYGPRQRPRMALSELFRSVYNNRPFPAFQDIDKSGRDYTYVKDICNGVYLASKKQTGYQIFNLGASRPVTLREFVEATEKVVGKSIEVNRAPDRPGEIMMTYADSSKAKNMLDWKPEYTVEKGIIEAYNWFKKQPEWYKKGAYKL